MYQFRTQLPRALVVALVGLVAIALAAPAHSAPSRPRDPHGAQRQLDTKGRQAPAKIAGWWVDESTQQLVVNVVGPRDGSTDGFTAGTDPASVRVEPFSAPVRPLADFVDGQAITTSAGARCSIGVSARSPRTGNVYVLTAGHCTKLGGTWSGVGGATIGPVAATNYPSDDFGAVRRDNVAAWTPTGLVQGGPAVKGSTEARVGAQICRSGSTTGYRCGTIQAKNQTVNYGNGEVIYGLTRTSACAEPGDSGGTFVTPAGQAQGMLSGGSGNCTVGGSSFYQPINEVLQRYGLTLVTR